MSDDPKLCSICDERPAGPGGLLCGECRTRIEAHNREHWGGTLQ
ncbi:hypothetical protein [Nocardia niwae]|nr:hypothetical protein [Nocardia niwae]